MKVWQERISAMYGDENPAENLIATTYCTILESGKDDGEYSDRDKDLMLSLTAHLGDKTVKILDAAVLEDIRLVV